LKKSKTSRAHSVKLSRKFGQLGKMYPTRLN
jgi:hypothetical protein